jgi:hypothetical protein
MAAYLVTYDLRKTRNDEALTTAIQAYGTWAQVLDSVWVILTSKTAEAIRDDLRAHMDSGDGLLVVKSGVESAWINVNCKHEWLNKHL